MTAINVALAFRWCLLCLLTLILLTPVSAPIDLFITRLFYQDGHFATGSFYDLFYTYGILPAWLTIFVAFGMLLGSLYFPSLKAWRRAAWFLILTLAIGSGLIIHIGLKDHWGRPRPKQVIEFGGQKPFQPYYQPNFNNQNEPAKSFPCGHCSMGFYFFSVALLGLHYRKAWLYYIGMLLAWGLGSMLSFVRIAQGGHFFSDTLVSALIMWLTAQGFYYWLFVKETKDERLNSKAT